MMGGVPTGLDGEFVQADPSLRCSKICFQYMRIPAHSMTRRGAFLSQL